MENVEKVALPPGWAWAKLGDICDIVGGITVDAKRRGPDLVELPYLRVANVQRGRLDLSVIKRIAVSQAQAERLRLCPGDVLLNEGGDRDKVGRGWVWEGQIENCIFQNHVFRARPRHASIQPRWLSHYLNEAARPYFLSGSKQTTNLASLSLTKVAATPVAMPPANEQRRLIEVIEELLGEVDDVAAAMGRARGQMADYRASLLHAACTGALTADWRAANLHLAEDGSALLRRIQAERRSAWERAELARLTAVGKVPREDSWKQKCPEFLTSVTETYPPIPSGWVWATLADLCDITGGITVDAKRRGAGMIEVPYLRVANVQRGHLNLTTMKQIAVPLNQAERLRLQPGDVVLNEGGDRDKVGRGWVWEGQIDNCIFQNHVFRARPRHKDVHSRWLSHYLNEAARPYFLAGAKQTTNLATLSLSKVAATPVPLPPVGEQLQAIGAIEALLVELEEAEPTSRLVGEISDLRQSILHVAFSGRLVPQDPAEEPAAALLARLRTEAAPSTPRCRAARIKALRP